MSKQITTTVYTLAELQERGDKAAVAKALDWLREGATDHDWWDYVYDAWKTALAQVGLLDADLAFSGFWSQGDGASFSSRVDVATFAKFLAAPPEGKDCIEGDPEDFRPWLVNKVGGLAARPEFRRLVGAADYIDAKVERGTSRYSHENTCSFYAVLERRTAPKVDALTLQFQQAGEEFRLAASRALYRDLEAEYDYLTSDEALAEHAAANEYTFTEGGKRFG